MLLVRAARLRRVALVLLSLVAACLGLALLIVPPPDLSEEDEVLRRVAALGDRVKVAESENARLHYAINRISPGSPELSLPSVADSLPHLARAPEAAFRPAFASYGRRIPERTAAVTLGIPTVRRPGNQSYLDATLRSVFANMDEEEAAQCLVIVLVAETEDPGYAARVSAGLRSKFAAQMDSGLLEVISPPAEFYPDLGALRRTLGDDSDRVRWRSKQNLDYAFLMMYAKRRSTYYVQLEDDVVTKPRFVRRMLDAASEWTAARKPWFVIDFCQLGFIGKLFRSDNLPKLVSFLLSFYNDKPVDWLLFDVVHTMACSPSRSWDACKADREALWLRHKPSLFQHVGTYSSLKGKVQKLKDKQFGGGGGGGPGKSLFVPHKNPPGAIECTVRHHARYSIDRAYRGETFFWGLAPTAGDEVTFTLTPPAELEAVRFRSGNSDHPDDRFVASTTVEALFAGDDAYADLGHFAEDGAFDVRLDGTTVRAVRISVHATSTDNWVVLSEIHLKLAQPASS